MNHQKILFQWFCLVLTLVSSSFLLAAPNKMTSIKVTNILPTELVYTGKADERLWQKACDNWTLSAKQIEHFFEISNEYTEKEYNQHLVTVDWGYCSINGTLRSGDRYWNFEINSSGVAEWYSDDDIRMWACVLPVCQMFLIQEKDKPVSPKKTSIKVIKVLPSIYEPVYDPDLDEQTRQAEEQACKSWQLTAEQIEHFYQLSDEYLDGYNETFHWAPCNIYGELESDGEQWQFSINQSATSIWRSDKKLRFWQCDAEKCKDFNMLLAN